MLDELILQELGRLETKLGSTEAGDSVGDVLLLGSNAPTIVTDDKQYLRAGYSVPLSEAPNHNNEICNSIVNILIH